MHRIRKIAVPLVLAIGIFFLSSVGNSAPGEVKVTRTIRRFPVRVDFVDRLRGYLDEINNRRDEVMETLKFEGCTHHEMYMEDVEGDYFLVIVREDTKTIGTFAERRQASGLRIYDLLDNMVSECLDSPRLEILPPEYSCKGALMTLFWNR